jgi:predicted hexulose-6-phosphate isomerase
MAKDNGNLSIGIYEKALPASLSMEQKLVCAKQAGYSFMELSIDESDERITRLKWNSQKRYGLREISEKTGVPFITMCISGNRRYPLGSPDAAVRKKGLEMILDAIYFASDTGIRILQIAAYDVHMGHESTVDSRQAFGENLQKCVKLASSLGVMLALENVDCKFGESLENLMFYVEKINSPWLRLYPDFGNLSAMGQDYKAQIEKFSGHIAAIHVKDTLSGVVRNVLYGEGTVDFVSTFRVLKKANFYGPFLLEMWADKSLDNFEIIKNARLWVLDKLNQATYTGERELQKAAL